MRTTHWMQIAAVVATAGVAGTALADGVDRTTAGSGVSAKQGGMANEQLGASLPGARGAQSMGDDRMESTNSDNFDRDMSDYAAQHNGRITRQEFLDRMGSRFDRFDAEHRGYLTPEETHRMFVYAPGERAVPARTGSGVKPGDMGPGNSKGE